jgi:hypothetical protein
LAASSFWVPAGIARAQAQSQLAFLPPSVRRQREADAVGDGRIVGIGHEGRRNGGVDPHAALALLEQRQVLVEAVGRIASGPDSFHHVDEEGQRLVPLRLIELGVPVLVEPACAERVAGHCDEGAAFTPAGLAAQADAVDFVVAIVIAAAASRMNSQVGEVGISRPAFSIRSVRYMTIELSP